MIGAPDAFASHSVRISQNDAFLPDRAVWAAVGSWPLRGIFAHTPRGQPPAAERRQRPFGSQRPAWAGATASARRDTADLGFWTNAFSPHGIASSKRFWAMYEIAIPADMMQPRGAGVSQIVPRS